MGVQATGKSSFYAERFLHTHLRLNMDMLKTRHRESILLKAFVEGKASFVVDNTNPTRKGRESYIRPCKEAGYNIVGYYFRSSLAEAMERNAKRTGKSRVPDAGVRGTYAKLELPEWSEGFDELYYVDFSESLLKRSDSQMRGFVVEEWKDEV